MRTAAAFLILAVSTFIGEKARGETAALRHLANAAKILKNNSELLDLKVLQTMSSSSGNTYVMGVSARGSFQRSAFGMNYSVDNGWVGDEVELIIEFEAQRQ